MGRGRRDRAWRAGGAGVAGVAGGREQTRAASTGPRTRYSNCAPATGPLA